MGNHMKAKIEGIGTYRLVLDIGYHLDLFKTLYVPSISRNLVVDIYGFNFTFGHDCFSLYKNSKPIGSSVFVDDLHKLKLDDKFTKSLLIVHHNIGIKHNMLNESSAYL